MHETGTAKNLLHAIEKELKKHAYRKLVRVRIGVGALSGIEGDHLVEHLLELAPGSVIEGVALEAVELPPEFVCRSCGQTVQEKVVHTKCPRCGSGKIELERGKELTILSVDVE